MPISYPVGRRYLQSSRACERDQRPYLSHCTTTGTSTSIRIFYRPCSYACSFIIYFFQPSTLPSHRQRGRRSVLHSKHQYSSVPPKGTKIRSCRTVYRACRQFHSRTINRFSRCSMLTPVLRVGSSVCDHCSQSSECRIAER